MLESLFELKPFRELPITHAHPDLHSIIESVDDVDHHGRYACPGQHLPQQFSVDRVVGLLEVDEAHVKRNFPLSAQFLESADYEQHVDGGLRGAEAALFLR